LKRGTEARWIAETLVRSVRELAPGTGVTGAPALVIGYGTVGEQIAQVLRSHRMRVAVHDTEWRRLVAAHEAGYLTAPELAALLDGHRPLLVVSSTGLGGSDGSDEEAGESGQAEPARQASGPAGQPAGPARPFGLGGEDLDFLPGDCFVAGISGRASEIDLAGLAERAEQIEDLGRAGVRYTLPNGPVTVLADGLPVNLPFGDAVPARQSDLTMAAVVWGACTLARPGHGFAAGHNVARTDASLAESGLVERYYRLYGRDR
jgi:S-adenosylhomocysteine hydrolase